MAPWVSESCGRRFSHLFLPSFSFFLGQHVRRVKSMWLALIQTHKPITSDRTSLCLTCMWPTCASLHVTLTLYWFRWLDWCSGELWHWQADGLIRGLLLYHILIIIQVFSRVSYASCELTLTTFVPTLRETAVIMHVRDSTMAFSWNCPPTHVGFSTFLLQCSQVIPWICKRARHANNYSTQWFRRTQGS